MEMIDVLNKLQEIADKSPEVAKAVENVEKTNPKEVSENAVESEAPTNKEPVKEYEDKIEEYSSGSFKDFLTTKGVDIYKLKADEYSKYAGLKWMHSFDPPHSPAQSKYWQDPSSDVAKES